jgi:GT2 family glycosyltransferase
MAAPFAAGTVGAAFGPVRGLSQLPGGGAPAPLPPGPGPQELWAYAHGASMGVRRPALVDAGGFDERFGPGAAISGGEEGDLVLRLREHGWTIAVADAPTVRHLDWRQAEEDDANVLVYEHGAGAYLGAGLRRSPRTTAKILALRLLFERELWRGEGRGMRYGARASAQFARGLADGYRLSPRRWL